MARRFCICDVERNSHQNFANAFMAIASKGALRLRNTGFSLCDFEFRTRGKANRLKSVLPKPDSHRTAIQHVNFAKANGDRSRVCEKCGLKEFVRKKRNVTSPPRKTGDR